MRKAVFLLCALLFLVRIGLATELSGPLTGNLPLSGSPYQVVGDIWVPQSGSLVIEPGVALDFQGYCKFSIKQGATLQAVGTAADSIVFSCDTLLNPQKWVGIRFDTSASNSIMQYCRVEHAMESGIACIRSSPAIENCLIKRNIGANWDMWLTPAGGGIACLNASAAVIRWNRIEENDAAAGAGIYAFDNSYPRIIGNDITNNGDYYGAGLYFVSCAGAEIRDNVISGNVGDDGTAINFASNYAGRFLLVGNSIIGNEALYSGPVINVSDIAELRVENNVISANISPASTPVIDIFQPGPESRISFVGNLISDNVNRHGAAIGVFYGGHVYFSNNAVVNNYAWDTGGGGLYIRGLAPEIINNIFWNNSGPEIELDDTIGVSHCDIQGGFPGEGNIDVDPLFRDTTSGNYHLMSTACGDLFDSPCIDAGSPDYRDDTLSCQWGLGDSLCDMGAYGGGIKLCRYMIGDANDNGSADGVDVVYLVNYFKLGIAPGYICDCPAADDFYAPADVNGTCEANGVDVTYYVNYLKGYGPALTFCIDCPPMVR